MEFDDAFDDDELDRLTEAAFRELEQKALQATQAQAKPAAAVAAAAAPPVVAAPAPAPAPQPARQPPFRPPRPAAPGPAPVAQPLKAVVRPQGSQLGRVYAPQFRQPVNRPPASQLSRPSASQFSPPSRPPASQFPPLSRPPGSQSTAVHRPFIPPRPAAGPALPVRSASQTTDADADALQTRLAELTQQLTSSRGETAILRSHLDRIARDHAAHIAATRARYDAQIADFKASLDGAQTAERRVKTELAFLQQEARERSAARAATAASAAKKAPSTPKKSVKTWDLADGFGDDARSPRRRKDRGTPKGKRKRELSMGQLDVGPAPETDTDTVNVGRSEVKVGPVSGTSDRGLERAPTPSFDFLRLLLDHQSAPHASTFDALSQHTLPSLSHHPSLHPQSLATSLLHAVPAMGSAATHPLQLLADFAAHILALLAGCVAENVPAGIAPLAVLLGFTLRLHTWSILPGLLPSLVPTLAAALTHVMAQQRAATSSTSPATAILLVDLLYFSALGCGGDAALRRLFWTHMTRDAVSLCLSRHAPPAATIAMLDMLCTSAQPDAIGPVSSTMSADAVAQFVLERISRLLLAAPTDATRDVQRAALRTLRNLAAQSALARDAMARDGVLLARIAETLAAAVAALYDVSGRSACVVSGPTAGGFGGRDVSALSGMAGLGIELLHMLVAGDAEMQCAARGRLQSELAQGDGSGVERLVVGLSRVNFADEDGLFEAWVDAEAGERAMQVLDVLVTAAEGEAIAEAFGGV